MNKIFVPFLPPWVETGLQPAFYDKESGTVLQQTARMYNKVNCLIRNFNQLSKETKETVDEYVAKFTELKDFVDNYFDNLDVQEEINNKLDEMVEDGTLEVLIQHILSIETITLFDSLQDLIAAESINSAVVETLGFYAKGDGGGARYYISDSGTADGIFVYALDSGKYATLTNTHEFNLLQVGCKRNIDFDNASILSYIFKNGLSDTTVYVPEGTYNTTTINYAGDNSITDGFKFIGIGNPVLKLIHSNKTSTTKGTYNKAFTVTYGFDELNLVGHCSVSSITLADGKIYTYLAIDNSSLIPSSLAADMVIKGKTSGCEAYIASIDTSNPDGAGTARIYLYAVHNDQTKELNFNLSSSNLNEQLIVKNHLGNGYLYIRFNDNIIPSYLSVNDQIKQGDKTARVNNTSIVYENIHYIELNCMPEIDIFNPVTTYIASSTPFTVYSYNDLTAGMISLNKYINSSVEGITFDGGNLEVSHYESSLNRWNSLITGGCKNISIRGCRFINSVMAGLQIGGIGNTNSPASHDFPENVEVDNCYFYNNGRGDIEVIYGRHINITRCNGNGTLDIETNGSEILENININGCNFDLFSPYSPATSTQSTLVSASNCVFNTIRCQQKINLNLVNCTSHYLQPYACIIHAANCSFDFMNDYHGNEHMYISNSSFYGLYQSNPASQFGNEDISLVNCIIDLSICNGEQKLWNIKRFACNDTLLVSQLGNKVINDNKSNYDFNNVTIKLVQIKGFAGSPSSALVSTFNNCKFLASDNTAETSEFALSNNLNGLIVKNSYIETHLAVNNTCAKFSNNIVNHVTKPYFHAYFGIYVNNLSTDNNSGISWNWIKTGNANDILKFSGIEFNTSVSSTLGVTGGKTSPTVNNVNAGSSGYFVDDTNHALVQLYHNGSSLATRYVNYS